jgi:propanol-preferring alcohol dehydrogenase
MRAMLLDSSAPIESSPLHLRERPEPTPRDNEVRVRIEACGVCRTDLHVIEAELPPKGRPLRWPTRTSRCSD